MMSVEFQSVIDDSLENNRNHHMNSNESNTNQTSCHDTVSEETRIAALEKQISFLQTTQDSLLQGLHVEIENLRRENKALQFRLVMCKCCSNKSPRISKEDLCESRVLQLEDEVEKLKKLLIAEQKSKATLMEQIETMKSTKWQVSNSPAQLAKEDTVSPTLIDPSANIGANEPQCDPVLRPVIRKWSESTQPLPSDRERSELSQSEPFLRPGMMPSDLIPSPSLQDSASTPIVLSPRATLTATEGQWGRRLSSHLYNEEVRHVNMSANTYSGTRVVPIRLPLLKNEKPLSHAVVNNVSQNILTPTLIVNDRERQCKSGRMASLSRPFRVLRNSITHSSLGTFNQGEGHIQQLSPRAASQPQNPEPFLPALDKSESSSLIAQKRRPRILERKRLDRSRNLFHP